MYTRMTSVANKDNGREGQRDRTVRTHLRNDVCIPLTGTVRRLRAMSSHSYGTEAAALSQCNIHDDTVSWYTADNLARFEYLVRQNKWDRNFYTTCQTGAVEPFPKHVHLFRDVWRLDGAKRFLEGCGHFFGVPNPTHNPVFWCDDEHCSLV